MPGELQRDDGRPEGQGGNVPGIPQVESPNRPGELCFVTADTGLAFPAITSAGRITSET